MYGIQKVRGKVGNLNRLSRKRCYVAGRIGRLVMGLAEQAERKPGQQRDDGDPEHFVNYVVDGEESTLAADVSEDSKFEDLPENIQEHDKRDTGETGILASFFKYLPIQESLRELVCIVA